jgi:hypothetical protein
MGELESRLTALAAELEWPATPPVSVRLEPAAARRPRRGLVLAVALAVLAVALAFAVPESRSAILRFLHLGGVTVERVTTLPDADEHSLGSDLGVPARREEAEAALGGKVELPRVGGDPQLYVRDGIVSALLAAPEPVLVSQFRSPDGASILKKVAGLATVVEPATIDAEREGLWIAGAPHVAYWLTAPPRLAGNVLLWEQGGVTYRIEGKTLTKERALELAREMPG